MLRLELVWCWEGDEDTLWDEEYIGWPCLWDMALENGQKCIDGIKNLVQVIAYHPDHVAKPSPLCDMRSLLNFTLLDHVIEQHSSTVSICDM